MKYLIDTDWVIDHLRQVEATTRKLEELAPEGLALSIVSLAELYEGVYYSRDPAQSEKILRSFLSPELEVLGIDDEVSQIFGKERGRLRQQGKTIGDIDLFIAATSLRHHLTLLSNNRRHFEAVEGLEIISI
jgi:tRNA(fMet)-specific endonuclease VapC